MVDILRNAVSGLMAFRTAMAITSHNVANVNTPYYSRQRVELGTPSPEQQSYGYLGRGVDIQGITRAYDEFLMKQLRGHGSGVSQYDTLNNLTGQMSALLGDTEVGLTPDLEKFFGALQDLANSPASIPARQVFLDEARTLTTRVQDIDSALTGLRDSVNTGIRNTVTTINDLTAGIAKINQDIAQATKSPTNPPNDLLDNRDRLLMDLSKLVGIQVVAQDNGGINVFMGSGQPLVVGNNAYRLEAAQSGFDPRELTVRMEGQAQGGDLERYITGGELGGYFEFRRTILNPAQDGLGLLAMGLAETFNAQHAKGMNLDGETGVALFATRSPKVWANSANQSTATFNATLIDSTALVRSDYEIRYDGANYSAVRLSDQKTLLAGGDLATLNTELNKDGLSLTLSGSPTAGDRFLIQPTRQGSASFELLVSDPRKVAAAAPITTSAATSNLGTGGISSGTVVDSNNANLLNSVTIEFTAVDQFTVTDTITNDSFTQAYDSVNGTTVSYNGWEITLSGNPQAGDTFEVKNNIGGIGDNRNALELVKLEIKPQLMGGNDYRGVYAQMIAEVGAQGRRVESTLRSQEALLAQAEFSRESVSGVSLDEEAANLVRFQQAYEASAQMIQTANAIFKTLLDAVRS